MKTFLVSRIGNGKRLHIVNDTLDSSLCGRVVDATEYKMQAISKKSKRICISCRCARKEGTQ